MLTTGIDPVQQEIMDALKVLHAFNPSAEIVRRTTFLTDQLIEHDKHSLVLGISGGVDSLVAGYLAQHAAEQVKGHGHQADFIALRLPYGIQSDEEAAQRALKLIEPHRVLTIDIKPAADAMLQQLRNAGLTFENASQEDFILGNIKARQRMIAHYSVAGATNGLVIGTDHAAEALMGFFTKFGDGAADITPLYGLNKHQVRQLALAFGAPEDMANKVPTADLETLAPGKPDEEALGASYEQIDDFLSGKPIEEEVRERIVKRYRATAHKRGLPSDPYMTPPRDRMSIPSS